MRTTLAATWLRSLLISGACAVMPVAAQAPAISPSGAGGNAAAPQVAAPAPPPALPGDKAVAAVLAPVVAENAALARQFSGPQGLGARLEAAHAEGAALEARLAALQVDRTRIEARVAAAGDSEAVGLLLWRQRAGLPSEDELLDALRNRQDELNAMQVRLLDADEQADLLADPAARIAEQMTVLPGGLTADERTDIESGLRLLYAERSQLLEGLRDLERQCYEAQLDVESRQRTLARETESFRTFVTEHVLWLRSATPLDEVSLQQVLTDGWQALRWLVHPGQWAHLLSVLGADARRRPWLAAFGILLLGLLVRLRWPLRRRIDEAAVRVSRHATDSFRLTLDVLASSVLLAIVWPLVWGWLSWRLTHASGGGDFERSIGAALRPIAIEAFGLAVAHKICRPRGLAEAHFHWPAGAVRALRWTVRLLALVWLPLVFVGAVMAHHRNDAWAESLGRASFVAASVYAAVILRRVLRARGSILAAVAEHAGDGWTWRLRKAWCSALVLLPLAAAVLALTGYYYTALVLQAHMQATFLLCAALAVAYALVLRWMTVARRQLLLATARARRASVEAASEESKADDGAADVAGGGSAIAAAAAALDEAQLDLELVNEQSRRLLRAVLGLALLLGTWGLWADVLPAFDVLNRVTLWHHADAQPQSRSLPMVDLAGRPMLDAKGAQQMGMAPVEQAVTLVNLLAALLAAAMGIIAARNVPGLLELAVLRRLPIAAAGRYAAKTLARYALVVATIVAVFGALGVAWGDIQWLAAAVTVGLGFGMQEIFANFVAGIILLLERPIRVGDTITVGGVTGDVSRIRMRATTITDWDRRELLVPNKEFITGQVVNWTLSDSVLRVVLPVGVAYGSDTARVCSLLEGLARRERRVLDDPAPTVLFTGFGDSTLNFELRVFVDSPADFRIVRHGLNLAIDAAFREAGIEIAFPQRDLHIRSVPPGWEQLGGPARPPAPEAPRAARV